MIFSFFINLYFSNLQFVILIVFKLCPLLAECENTEENCSILNFILLFSHAAAARQLVCTVFQFIILFFLH